MCGLELWSVFTCIVVCVHVHVRVRTLNRSIYVGVLLVIHFSLIWSSEKLSSELI